MTKKHSFGKSFKKCREARGISLKEAASDIISPQLLSQFENEKKNVSLDNFNRLLISIGVSFRDFAKVYGGDSIDLILNLYYQLLQQKTLGILSMSQLKEELIGRIDPYLKDNEILKELFINHLVTHSLSQDVDLAAIRNIKKYSHISFIFRNELENMILLSNIKNRPLEDVLGDIKQMIEMAQETWHREELMMLGLAFPIYLDFLSTKGFYQKGDQIIKIWDDILSVKGEYISFENQLAYLFEKTFHYLRQDDKKGIYLAHNIIELLDNPIVGMSSSIRGAKKFFITSVAHMNNTGLPFNVNKT